MGLRKVGKVKTAVFLFLVFSMQLLPASTSPAAFPVVVVLSGDEPVMYTANKIGELLQNAMVVEKDSVFGSLILMRAVGEVIYVGHGTQQGIKVGGNIVSWENFAKEIRYVPSKTIYVAACYSENIAKIAEKNRSNKIIFGFKGLIDVDEAAYITTATITAIKGNAEKAGKLLKELTEIMFGKIVEPWKYKLWLLYETKQIRGIWHVKYDPYLPDVVDYTHPDYYFHYENQINIDDWWEKENSNHNLYTVMVPRRISGWAAEAMMAALFAYVGAHFSGPLGAAAGLIAGRLVGSEILKDEKGVIWYWMKDWTVQKLWWNIYRIEWDWKMGAMCWWHYYGIGVPEFHTGATWPLWYGGNLLGLPEAPGW